MLRLRLGLRLGPFIVTSSPRRRARVPSMPGITLRVLACFALGLGFMIFVGWLGR